MSEEQMPDLISRQWVIDQLTALQELYLDSASNDSWWYIQELEVIVGRIAMQK